MPRSLLCRQNARRFRREASPQRIRLPLPNSRIAGWRHIRTPAGTSRPSRPATFLLLVRAKHFAPPKLLPNLARVAHILIRACRSWNPGPCPINPDLPPLLICPMATFVRNANVMQTAGSFWPGVRMGRQSRYAPPVGSCKLRPAQEAVNEVPARRQGPRILALFPTNAAGFRARWASATPGPQHEGLSS